MKASPDELIMHQRLLSRDPVACAKVIADLYDGVVRGVQQRAGGDCDVALAEEQASEALLVYAENPERYDPERGSLRKFLIIIGHSRYKDALRRGRRRGPGVLSLSDPHTAAVAEGASEDATEEPSR